MSTMLLDPIRSPENLGDEKLYSLLSMMVWPTEAYPILFYFNFGILTGVLLLHPGIESMRISVTSQLKNIFSSGLLERA